MPAAVPGPAPRDPATLEVWWSPIDLPPRQLDGLRADLDAETRERIELLVRPDDRRRAIVAHAVLRRRVGALLGAPPSELRIRRSCAVCGATDHGKPAIVPVDGAPPPPEINLAHSGNLALVAVSAAAPIGVDVERHRPGMDWDAHHAHVFADDEWAATGTAADPAAARLMAWTRKEAAAKATGHGVAVGLERVRVSPDPDADGWHAVTLPDGLGPARLHDVAVPAGHVAAVAIAGAIGTPALRVTRAEL